MFEQKYNLLLKNSDEDSSIHPTGTVTLMYYVNHANNCSKNGLIAEVDLDYQNAIIIATLSNRNTQRVTNIFEKLYSNCEEVIRKR